MDNEEFSGINASESFADKLKSNTELQVAIYSDPTRVFTDNEKLDVADSIGNALFELSEIDNMPSFVSTVRRDRYIVVTCNDLGSCNWLLTNVPNLKIWENTKMACIMAKDIPKLTKGLLWLPGRQKLSNEEILKRLEKQNRELNTTSWRIFSRKEEDHGIRLLVGIDKKSEDILCLKENRPQWTTCRAQFTPIELMSKRKNNMAPVPKINKTGNSISYTNSSSSENNVKLNDKNESKVVKRKPDVNLSSLSNDSFKDDGAAIKETDLLQDSADPFTPTRLLPRSPKQTSSYRQTKKKKDMESPQPEHSGKITTFFSPTNLARSSSADRGAKPMKEPHKANTKLNLND